MIQTKENVERADRAKTAVVAYLTKRGDFNPEGVIESDWSYLADLLCDLRHLADSKGLDFDALNDTAFLNYADEVKE